MSIYFVTGKLGAGKTLSAVGRIMYYLSQGRRVATNLDLFPENFNNKHNRKIEIVRLPDKPEAYHMETLGRGYDGDKVKENKNGLIVLDECGTWLNSRTWNDKGRADLIDWFLHARKLRWDIIFIVQDLSIIDKQVRQTLCEHLGVGKRLDRFQLPAFANPLKLIGIKIKPPRFFIMKIYYGDNESSMVAERWKTLGTYIFNYYDTEQVFTNKNDGIYSMLTPWHLVGRYQAKKTYYDYANILIMPLIRKILSIYIKLGGSFTPYSYVKRAKNV